MCNHILRSRQIFVISGTGSTLAADVVPTVAMTARGLNFSRRSRSIITRSAAISFETRGQSAPVGRFLRQGRARWPLFRQNYALDQKRKRERPGPAQLSIR